MAYTKFPYVTTHLAGPKTRFLPFNQGKFGGALGVATALVLIASPDRGQSQKRCQVGRDRPWLEAGRNVSHDDTIIDLTRSHGASGRRAGHLCRGVPI